MVLSFKMLSKDKFFLCIEWKVWISDLIIFKQNFKFIFFKVVKGFKKNSGLFNNKWCLNDKLYHLCTKKNIILLFLYQISQW